MRLHVSLRQAKEIPNVHVTASSSEGKDNAGAAASAVPPHAFLVIEDFLYHDAPSSSSSVSSATAARASVASSASSGSPPRGTGAGASAAELIGALGAVRLPSAGVASTTFRDFFARIDDALAKEVAEGEAQQQNNGGTKPLPSAIAAEWAVDGVVRGCHDRTLVAGASNRPQFNYEASVTLQHPPSSSAAAAPVGGGDSKPSAPTMMPLSGMIVSLCGTGSPRRRREAATATPPLLFRTWTAPLFGPAPVASAHRLSTCGDLNTCPLLRGGTRATRTLTASTRPRGTYSSPCAASESERVAALSNKYEYTLLSA